MAQTPEEEATLIPLIVEVCKPRSGITVKTPCDPETDPLVIESRHRRMVSGAVHLGLSTPEEISAFLCLPVWNVVRALCHMRKGFDWVFPSKFARPKRFDRQNPGGLAPKYKTLKPKVKVKT